MPNNLYALVGDRQPYALRRVQVVGEIQEQLAGLFFAYNAAFLEGIDEEIEFTHSWKADDDQLFYIADNEQAEALAAEIAQGALAMEPIDPDNLDNEKIRALIFAANENGPLYIQYFYAAQQLARRGFTLFFDGDTFTRFEQPGFSIGQRIDAIYSDGRLRFKNFNIIKRVFDVLQNYTEASDEQIEQFAAMDAVHIEDLDFFKGITNQTTRRLISAIANEGTLALEPVQDIAQSAQAVGLEILIADGKIVFPTDKSHLKHLLRFLDHGIYSSPLAPDRRFIANSKMRFGN